MRAIKILILGFGFIYTNTYAKNNDIWNDVSQDSIQVDSPIEFINSYGGYTVIGVNKKIKLVDFGNIEKKDIAIH